MSSTFNSLAPTLPQLPPLYNKIPLSSFFYYGSLFFMVKTSFDIFINSINIKKRKNQVNTLLNQLKQQYKIKDQSNESLEVIYFIYYKCFNEVFSNEFTKFKSQRRFYLKANNWAEYIKTCRTFYKEFLPYEEETLFQISKIFNINYDIVKSVFSREEIDYKKMKGRYYSQRDDIEIPNDLDIKKVEEIIQFLYKKFIFFYNKVKQNNILNIKEEKIQLIAEYYAFDCVNIEYEIEYEVIEKYLYLNNLSVIEY